MSEMNQGGIDALLANSDSVEEDEAGLSPDDLEELAGIEEDGGMDVIGEDFAMEDDIQGAGSLQSVPHALELLQDVNLEVVVELGRTRKPLREILAFTPGNVIELNSLIGDSVDILINDRLIARGEVVAFEDQLGVRITSIVTAEDLIKKTLT